MDPEAALREAKSELGHAECRGSCAEHLSAYFSWRLGGGFEPKNGDMRALEMLEQLGRVADTLSQALNQTY